MKKEKMMKKRFVFRYLIISLIPLITACGPKLSPGVDLSGANLHGRDLGNIDLSGATLSNADLSNTKMGMGGKVEPEKTFSGMFCSQFVNNGGLLALCEENSLKFWDIQTRAIVKTIKIPDEYYGVALSPDGKFLALSSSDGIISLLNTETQTISSLKGNSIAFLSVAFSPNSLYLAIGGEEDYSIQIWDVNKNTGSRIYWGNSSFIGLNSMYSSFPTARLVWSHDSKTLAYVTEYDTFKYQVEFWDMKTGALKPNIRPPYFQGDEAFLDWSPDNSVLAIFERHIAQDEKQGGLLDTNSGTYTPLFDAFRECDACTLSSVAWSPTRPIIAGGFSDGKIVFWDSDTGAIIRVIDSLGDVGVVKELNWSTDGLFLQSWGDTRNGKDQLWDVQKIFKTTILTGANISNANLSGADMTGIDLRQTTLIGANMNGANLSGANLSGLDLQTTTLVNANLSSANLANSNLSGVNLSGVNFSNAMLENTNLAGADLRGAGPIAHILKPVCKGVGINPMPAYTNQPGIHPLLILGSDGEIHLWSDAIPDEWRPTNDQLPEIVVCVEEMIITKIKSCQYGMANISMTAIPLMQSSVHVTVRDAHSGSIIDETTIVSQETCPEVVTMGTESIGGRHPTFSDAETWLKEYVIK